MRATDAKNKSDEAQIKERIQLAYHSALTKDITGENGELTMLTLQEELDNEFTDKSVVITESEDKKKWIIKVDEVEVSVAAGKETKKSNLTQADITAINTWNIANPTDLIAELSIEEITQLPNATAYNNNTRIKALLTGGVPLTTEMTYITGTKDTGVVVAIGKTENNSGNEFVWVPVPDVTTTNIGVISPNSRIDLATNPSTLRPMARLQSNGADYEGLLYDFLNGATSTFNPSYCVPNTSSYREPAFLTGYEGSTVFINNVLPEEARAYIPASTEPQTEYNDMVTSVDKYKGFYVARYELGLDSSNNAVSKKHGTGITTTDASNAETKTWYGLYGKCKSMYNDSSEKSTQNVTSQMIWGSQYDAMMNWMAKTGKTVGTNDYIKYNQAQTTGTSTTDITNNVYDLYGCHREFTQDAYNTGSRGLRGGCFDLSSGNSNYPGVRNSAGPNADDSRFSSRVSLYIKP